MGPKYTKGGLMNYFAILITAQAHSLYLPADSKRLIDQHVRQHQKGRISPEIAPFRRQLDFWMFSIVTAITLDIPPLDRPSSKWGLKFADTRSVQMSDSLCELLAVITLGTLGSESDDLDKPAKIIDLGNKLAGAGCPKLLEQLMPSDIRVSNLQKLLDFALALNS